MGRTALSALLHSILGGGDPVAVHSSSADSNSVTTTLKHTFINFINTLKARAFAIEYWRLPFFFQYIETIILSPLILTFWWSYHWWRGAPALWGTGTGSPCCWWPRWSDTRTCPRQTSARPSAGECRWRWRCRISWQTLTTYCLLFISFVY